MILVEVVQWSYSSILQSYRVTFSVFVQDQLQEITSLKPQFIFSLKKRMFGFNEITMKTDSILLRVISLFNKEI